MELSEIYRLRARVSANKLKLLSQQLANDTAVRPFEDRLAVFCAGSYAREEASEHSDIDLFFVYAQNSQPAEQQHTKELSLFGRLIEVAKGLDFPAFSNDSQYLETHKAEDVLATMGSRDDDARNYFTLRMLMILESKCILNVNAYDRVLTDFMGAYYRDYPDHSETFEPTFLLNDIGRFWKTLLLNYENRRLQRPADGESAEDEDKKIQQKVRNYKLKYSRMTTCFATVAALGSMESPVQLEHAKAIVSRTPRQRLEYVVERQPELQDAVQELIDGYSGFLTMTELPTVELQSHFRDKARKTELFREAENYGSAMFRLLQQLDSLGTATSRGLLRTLVI